MRVHIGYIPILEADHEPTDSELQAIGETLGIKNIKLRMRVISGDIAPEQLDELRARDDVKWVEVDQTRYAR